jgi:hypothetical protein
LLIFLVHLPFSIALRTNILRDDLTLAITLILMCRLTWAVRLGWAFGLSFCVITKAHAPQAPQAPQALQLAAKLLEHFGNDQLYCSYNIQTNKKR